MGRVVGQVGGAAHFREPSEGGPLPWWTPPRVWSNRWVSLDADSDLPAGGLSRRQLERSLERVGRIAAVLRDVGQALGATLELDELLALILDRLRELVEAERAVLFLLDEPRQVLEGRITSPATAPVQEVPVGEGLVGRVARTGRSLRLDRGASEPGFDARWDSLHGCPTKAALAAPLKNNLGRTIGVVEVVNRRDGAPFSEEDEAILATLSTQAAVAIDNSRLLGSLIDKNRQLSATKEQLERRVRDLELLFELERSTAQASSHDELARAVLERLARACDARAAGMLLRDEETQELVEYTFDVEEPLLRRRGQVTEGVLWRALTSNAPQRSVGEVATRAGPPPEPAFAFAITNYAAEPLEGEEGAIGALALFNKLEGKAFSEEDFGLLRLVSANLSTAVRLFDTNRAREREERLTSIGRLLSQVIHDFRSPMTVISGYVQLMEESDDPAQRRRYAEEILQQFEAVASMQREVLAFARGESDVFMRRVYVDRFFADLGRQLRHEVEGRNVELEFEIEPKLVARFDTERITRALFNLVRNAIEAMGDAGGRLTLRARRRGTALLLEVEDTGPGLPEAVKNRLFQAFVTANKPGGTGLGLAIVKRIVEQHGGSVSVSSSPGGTRFELLLPGQFAEPAPPRTVETPVKAPSRSPRPAAAARRASPRTSRRAAPSKPT